VVALGEKSVSMAESFLERSRKKLWEAEDYSKKANYAESISASQESIELSVKAIFLLMQERYPKRHWFKDEEFETLFDRLPKELDAIRFRRAFLHSKFWSDYYGLAKYGDEKLGIGPEKLFRREDAELALVHARECRDVARELFAHVTGRYKV